MIPPRLGVDDTILKQAMLRPSANATTSSLSWLSGNDLDENLKKDLIFSRAIDRYINGLSKYWEPGDQETASEDGYLEDLS